MSCNMLAVCLFKPGYNSHSRLCVGPLLKTIPSLLYPLSLYPQRIVALEEHLAFPDMVQRIPLAARQQAGWPSDDNPH